MFAALLGAKRLSKDELARLEAMVAAAQEEEQPMSLPEALFARYFTVGLQGALMAALVICLRAAAKRRAPRRLWPALWCVAALRLLVRCALQARGHFGRPMQGPAWAAGRRRRLRRPCCGHSFGWRAPAPWASIFWQCMRAALWRLRNAAPCACGGAGLFSCVAGAPPASG